MAVLYNYHHIIMTTIHPNGDRNFDDIAEHFEQKIYQSLKGKIRLAVLKQDLFTPIEAYATWQKRPLRILDIGAGIGQIAHDFANMGHHVFVCDISKNMINKAKAHSQTATKNAQFVPPLFINSAYQDLCAHPLYDHKSFDVILCHALLEWLENPKDIMDFIAAHLCKNGLLSLCFYNPASLIFRNLVMGNFYQLDKQQRPDKKSLTPKTAVDLQAVQSWLSAYHTLSCSGIRCFYDYGHKKGGLCNEAAVLQKELHYSRQEPFWRMGRYIHILVWLSN